MLLQILLLTLAFMMVVLAVALLGMVTGALQPEVVKRQLLTATTMMIQLSALPSRVLMIMWRTLR
ncbi:MAG: hypothetical protein D6698_15955 [Gammaproteobacteria bacterium]|nr:MAG: hypothetical protein D6698_15955 [Gammaproteobacteria bacterium]